MNRSKLALEIEADRVGSRFDLLTQIGLHVEAFGKQFLGDLKHFLGVVEAFLSALADNLLAGELDAVFSRQHASLELAFADDGALADRVPFRAHEEDGPL